MSAHDDAFCPMCDVRVDLHGGPDSCASAESKARVLETFFGGIR